MFVADRVQKYLFNDGALTPKSSIARFMKRKEELDRAVVGESARWGDAKRPMQPLTRQDWLRMVNVITNNYFPRRTATVLRQIKARGLYPSFDPPRMNQMGGAITNGFLLTLTATNGEVVYTLDGLDPRQIGGGKSKSAKTFSTPIQIHKNTIVKSRTLDAEKWSALQEARFIMDIKPQAASDLK